MKNRALALGAAFLAVYMMTKFALKINVTSVEDQNAESIIAEDGSTSSKSKRSPASIKATQRTGDWKPVVKTVNRAGPIEETEPAVPASVSGAAPESAGGHSANRSPSSSPRQSPSARRPPNDKPSPSKNSISDPSLTSSNNFNNAFPTDSTQNDTANTNLDLPKTPVEVRDPDSPVCTASVGSGAFSSPINVSITCSTFSVIKYCLSENACCDPSSGTKYTGPITIGSEPKDYCLSFSGTSASWGKTSELVERSYSFNADLPDLQTLHRRTYYQTTQLKGLVEVASDNFGSDLHTAGVINLRSHDPGPSGLGMSCAEILQGHTSLTAPNSAVIMTETDVSGVSSTSQLDVYFALPELMYGNNYLTTYLANTLFANLASCSTTNVVLEDFPFFDHHISHGEDGSADVREFSGGFTSIGFFEEEAQVYRGPAGNSTEDVSKQELRTGIFGVFY